MQVEHLGRNADQLMELFNGPRAEAEFTSAAREINMPAMNINRLVSCTKAPPSTKVSGA